jgi:putative Ca2+/H+ antiporter (TMEM165/GDT1 family)
MGLSLKTELTTLADRSQTQPLADEPLQISIPPLRKELEIFASTFFTIFLAELGDKTQLTTLLMSAESRNPWIVFAGAGSALIATSLLGVLIGRWLATRVSPKTLETAAGMLLLLIAVMLLWDVVKI